MSNTYTGKIMMRIAGTLCAASLLFGCSKKEFEDPNILDVRLVAVQPEEMGGWEAVDTKSVLTAADIETKFSGAIFAVYTGGNLVTTGNFANASSTAIVNLRRDRTYNIYALANYGASAPSFPSSESVVPSMRHTVGSSSSVNTYGIPMAATVTGVSFAGSNTCELEFVRLFAKVIAHINATNISGTIRDINIMNLNGSLSPFSSSYASSSVELAPYNESAGAGEITGSTATAVFYVPENLQGTVGAISSSFDKSPTSSNPSIASAVSGKTSTASYLQARISVSAGLTSGDMYYRSFLGANETSDFNIERNHIYDWTINYLSENMYDFDWKRDGSNLTTTEYKVVTSVSSEAIDVYGSTAVSATRYTRTVTNGVATDWSSPVDVTPSGFKALSGSEHVSISGSTITGVSAGGSTIRSDYNDVYISVYEDATVMVSDVVTTEYKLVTSASSASISVGGTTSASAMLYSRTVTNGTPGSWDSGTNVTSSGFKVQTGGSFVSISGSTITGVSAGSGTIRSNYSSVSIDVYEDASLTVNDVVSTQYKLVTTVASSSIDVGGSTTASAKLYSRTVTNGTPGSWDSGTNVTSSGFKVQTGGSFVSISGSTITGASAGSGTIRSNYSSVSIDVYEDASLTVNDVVSTQYKLVTTVASSSIDVGGSTTASAKLYSRTVTNGTPGSWDSGTNVTSSGFKVQTGGSFVSISGSTITGASAGSGTIRSNYSAVSINFYEDASLSVSNNVTYELIVTGDGNFYWYNSGRQLTATFYTITNGVYDAGTDVTNSATWQRISGSSSLSVNGAGYVTGTAAGTATFRATYSGYSGTGSATAQDYVTYSLEVTSPSGTSLNPGNAYDLVATFYTITNGVANSGTVVTSNASTTWSSNSGYVTINYGGVKGRVYSSTDTSARITASYSGYSDYIDLEFSTPAYITFSPWQETVDWNYTGNTSFTASYGGTGIGSVSGFVSSVRNMSNCTSSDFSYGNNGATVWVSWNSSNTSDSSRYVEILLTDPVSGASDYVKVTQNKLSDEFDHYVYENMSISVSASPSSIGYSGEDYTVSITQASATRYEYWTVSGKKTSTATTVYGTPTVSTSGNSAFSSLSGTFYGNRACSVGENTSSSKRSVRYTASYQFASGYSVSDYADVEQAGAPSDVFDHYVYENMSISVSASPSSIGYSGGDYIVSITRASATRYEYWTISGKKTATATTVYGTPTVSTSGNSAFSSLSGTFYGNRACSVGENTSSSKRSVRYTASYQFASGYSVSDYADVEQAGIVYYLNISPSSDTADWNDTSVHSFTISTNCTGLSATRQSGSMNTDYSISGTTLRVRFTSNNTTGSNRSVTIRVNSTQGEYDSVTLTQGYQSAPTTTYKVVTSISSSSITVGDNTSASASLYSSTDGGSTWSYESNITSSGFYKVSGSGGVSFSGSTITGTSSGSATIRSNYTADVYQDATLTISDSYEIYVSGSTSALRTSSISLTPQLRKNGTNASATFSCSAISGSSYFTYYQSGSTFIYSAVSNRSCRYNSMDNYTVRFSVTTPNGTLTKDVDIVFTPTTIPITISLYFETSSFTSTSCTYYAESSEILPAEATINVITAYDNKGNSWLFDSPSHSLSTNRVTNPGGFNPGGNSFLARTIYINSISPNPFYSRSSDANLEFSAGSTKPY